MSSGQRPGSGWRKSRANLLASLAGASLTTQAAEIVTPPQDSWRDVPLLAYGGRVVPPMESARVPHPAEPAPSSPRHWEHALPFFAQKVIDRGIDLPNPYDFGFSIYLGNELRDLSDLSIAFNGGDPANASFVEFRKTRIKSQSTQLQAGAWIFPFLNAYALAGYTQGHGNIDIAIPGQDLMEFLHIPGCNLPPTAQPALCGTTLEGTAHAKYDGYSWGFGVTATGAWRQLFFSLPITYVQSDVSMSDTDAKTWNIAPRVGWNQHLRSGMITWYAGGTYMISDVHITGSFTFDTAGTVLGQDTTLDYSITVEPRKPWNYLAGAHWMMNRTWSVLGEIGFGGAREDVILNVFYRF